MYRFPVWRRVPFVALLIIVMVISYGPSTTQGTATVRLAAVSAPSIVTHLYVGISSIQLHREGFLFEPNNTGWIIVSQGFTPVDLLSQGSQLIPPTVGSIPIHSGRYDVITISFTNATLFIAGQSKPVAAPPPIQANVAIPVSPNGVGNILFVVAFDYSNLFTSQPILSFILVRVSVT